MYMVTHYRSTIVRTVHRRTYSIVLYTHRSLYICKSIGYTVLTLITNIIYGGLFIIDKIKLNMQFTHSRIPNFPSCNRYSQCAP